MRKNPRILRGPPYGPLRVAGADPRNFDLLPPLPPKVTRTYGARRPLAEIPQQQAVPQQAQIPARSSTPLQRRPAEIYTPHGTFVLDLGTVAGPEPGMTPTEAGSPPPSEPDVAPAEAGSPLSEAETPVDELATLVYRSQRWKRHLDMNRGSPKPASPGLLDPAPPDDLFSLCRSTQCPWWRAPK